MKREIRRLRSHEEKKHFDMLNLCFNPWGTREKWRRKYVQYPGFNPTKNVLVVEEDGEWVGGVTAWFREAVLGNGQKVRAYLAGDGYVHPSHRGKGIYSAFMRRLSKIALEDNAVLGFTFTSTYQVPTKVLTKYGFTNIEYPITKILIRNPEKFIWFLTERLKTAYFPKRFNNLKLKLIVSFNQFENRKSIVRRTFEIQAGKLHDTTGEGGDAEEADLTINTNINVLLKLGSQFYLRKRGLFLTSIIALLRRDLRLRFSWGFLKRLLGPSD